MSANIKMLMTYLAYTSQDKTLANNDRLLQMYTGRDAWYMDMATCNT